MEGIRNWEEHHSFKRTRCYVGHPTYMIPATLRLRNNATVIHVLIDTGCLQTNIINTRVADLLNVDGGTLYKTDIILTAGVGGHMAFRV